MTTSCPTWRRSDSFSAAPTAAARGRSGCPRARRAPARARASSSPPPAPTAIPAISARRGGDGQGDEAPPGRRVCRRQPHRRAIYASGPRARFPAWSGRLSALKQRLRGDKPPVIEREGIDNHNLELLLGFLLAEDSNCVDVGANEGRFLWHMTQRAPRGRHFAWEPVPHLAARLRELFPARRGPRRSGGRHAGGRDLVRRRQERPGVQRAAGA